jgi:hypothetical protein
MMLYQCDVIHVHVCFYGTEVVMRTQQYSIHVCLSYSLWNAQYFFSYNTLYFGSSKCNIFYILNLKTFKIYVS